ncbi:MAG: AAA family ATPase [Planctomycetota bacterium]|nr:AAA family ATPase [Planctomycetota bacterium]
MGVSVAVAGKGGVGKTTVSALLVRALVRAGASPVLAIDADPNSNLNEMFGLPPPKTIGDLMERTLAEKDGLPGGMSKTEFIQYGIEECLVEAAGFDLLAMGRPEGPGCYCFVNNLMREAISKLKKRYVAVVVDNEAGFEHMSRRTTRRSDVLLLVSDTSPTALTAARRASELASSLKLEIGRRGIVVNRAAEGRLGEEVLRRVEAVGVPLLGTIPADDALADIQPGGTVFDLPDENPAVKAAEDMVAGMRLLEGVGPALRRQTAER